MRDPLLVHSLAELQQRTSVKWRRYPPDVLPLWVAEMDVELAPAIVEAVSGAIVRGDTGYGSGSGYAEALAAFAFERWGWGFDVDSTALVPDLMLGVVELLKLVTRPGDGVVVNPPVYPPFYAFVSHLDRVVVDAPLDGGGRLDLAVLEERFARADVTAHLLCSPHNPTGTVHTEDELRAVATLADRNGVRVVVDEIHAPLVLDGPGFVPYLSLSEASRGLVVHSASKGWNLAGIRSAVAVAGLDATDDLAKLPEEVRHGADHLAVIAHTAALSEGRGWLDDLLAGLRRNRRLLVEGLGEHLPGIVYRPGAATFLAWLDARGLQLGDDPATVFLDRGRVALTAGPEFGSGGHGHARLNFATHPDVLEEALRRMAASL